MEDSGVVDTTLPISSSMFDGFCSPTGSFSDMTEPLSPSITLTPLGQTSPRHGCTTSADSRHSTASCFTSPNFNLPGYSAIRLGSLTPSVLNIAGSHHMSSTWPPSLFTSGPSTPQLTIDQANSIFSLASECQVLSIKLAKEFHVLSGLEAMHHNSIQGTAHKTLTLGHSAWKAAYSAILWDDITEAEHEALTCCLHSEADATWKEMHEVMYNHQLNYDWQLSAFLKETETTLNNMRDQVWVTVCTLAENEGITFNDCLSLTLQLPNLLPQIPVDISFQTQIPLTIAYCLESSIYRRWCPKQGGVSPLHKEVRASWTLSKVLGGASHQPSEGVDCPPSPAVSGNSVRSGRLQGSRDQSCSHAQSIASSRSLQSGSAHFQVTDSSRESISESELSHKEEDAPHEDESTKASKGEVEVLSDDQVASNSEEGQGHPQIQDTLTGVSQVFSTHKDTDSESNPKEKIQSVQWKRHQPSPKEGMPPKD